MNKSETHLITIFSVAIEQWLRPAAGAQTVDVGRAGGEVEVAGKLIGSHDEYGPNPSAPYVFFLKRLRGQAFIASGFLAMTGAKISSGDIPGIQKDNLLVEDFLREIRSVRCGGD